MREHLIGIIAMLGGFIAIGIQNYAGASCCFLFAFILWIVIAIDEMLTAKKSGRIIRAEAVEELARKLKEYYPSISDGIDFTAEEVLKD